ncbi:MAG: FtsX-like permease family protein, partial [Bacteroidota bacterium]
VAIAALLISLIGLYSSVSLMVQRRLKEFGVRKILGAGAVDISLSMNKTFIISLIIALTLGLTGGYLFISNLLDVIYAYHIEIEWYHFVVPSTVLVLSVGFTCGQKVYTAITQNPVTHLRTE